MYAPLVQFKHGDEGFVRRFIGRSISGQQNNITDEQYFVAAMICDRLITRDEGMRNIIEMFGTMGFTQCQILFLDPRGSILDSNRPINNLIIPAGLAKPVVISKYGCHPQSQREGYLRIITYVAS